MNPNPYASPGGAPATAAEIVDRQQRQELAALIRQFLHEDLPAFAFDERLDDFRDSPDSAVRFVSHSVWYHYDDCRDHLVALSKPEWDYFQRLLLLLESDRGVRTILSRRWSLSQLVALLGLVGFASVGFGLGWGLQLLVVAIPFGLVSMGISWTRRATDEVGPYDRILFPFATISDLKSAYDSVAFSKARYPRGLQSRRIRSPLRSAALLIQFHATWLLLSPIVLCCQMLPTTVAKTRVIAG